MSTRTDRERFILRPQIVQAGSTTDLCIAPSTDECSFQPEITYLVTVTPMEHRGETKEFNQLTRIPGQVVDGHLRVSVTFPAEQEYDILVEQVVEEEEQQIVTARVFAVGNDLFCCLPWKGDLHIHSNRSDGLESPAYVAAACRRIGLDFMAVTDHGRYAPSLEAQAAFAGLPIDLRIYPGEEVHPPENPIHIINFGGSRSVNEAFQTESYQSEVGDIDTAAGNLPAELDRYFCASTSWSFRKIRESGGLSIFCHPYWVAGQRYHIPGSLMDQVFQEREFDAFELIGGYHRHEVESNFLQVSRYSQERSSGNDFPVVGVSDAHGCDRGELFGWYYTIVFAASPDFTDLVAAIRAGWCVAVEALPGQTPRAHGQFRFARYAQFLLREVLPGHDALCLPEGEAMARHVAGETTAVDDLQDLRGAVSNYYQDVFDAQSEAAH